VRASAPEAVALSDLLRRGQLHAGVALPEDFRTVASIQRKTFDIATADPSYEGKKTRGGKLDLRVILAFRSDRSGMQAKAAAIRAALALGETRPANWQVADDLASDEGSILEFLARRRERDPKLRLAKLAEAVAAGLPLGCEVCGFNFGENYGPRGDGYIEVHHRRPLHVSGATRTRVGDLALLCANCHRMCHRGEWISPERLMSLRENQKSPCSCLKQPQGRTPDSMGAPLITARHKNKRGIRTRRETLCRTGEATTGGGE
jgi:5-methylcytosine-specific restriction enzyme A